jgi:hypothetical protein
MPQVDFNVVIAGESFADGESQATGSSGNSCTSQAPQQAEGVTMIEPTVTAGTSRSGRACTMSRRMAESTSQALRDVISIMGLLQEMSEHDFKVLCTKLYVYSKSLTTTQVPSNWQGFPSFALEPSTSMYATIIFANMCGKGLSKYSPLTPRIRLLTLLPSP